MHNQDNITRQKMQELKEVPKDISFDAAKVWQRMEAELQPKEHRKNYLLWLSIAAIFLLIISTVVIYSNHDKKQTGSTEIVQPQKEKYFFNDEQQLQVNKTINADQPIIHSKKKTNIQTVINNVKVTDSIVIKQPSTPPIEIPVATIITPEVATTTQPITVTTKKKLRVVHLNDLYKPVSEEIVKAEIKKQSNEEVAVETEPVITTPSKPFWKAKAPQKTAITLNDNQ